MKTSKIAKSNPSRLKHWLNILSDTHKWHCQAQLNKRLAQELRNYKIEMLSDWLFDKIIENIKINEN